MPSLAATAVAQYVARTLLVARNMHCMVDIFHKTNCTCRTELDGKLFSVSVFACALFSAFIAFVFFFRVRAFVDYPIKTFSLCLGCGQARRIIIPHKIAIQVSMTLILISILIYRGRPTGENWQLTLH